MAHASPTSGAQPDSANGATEEPRVLRVCADPNNLPFSNRAGEGFENRIAELLAADLGAELEYAWAPQRRGFVRTTLNARLCDVVIGAPTSFDLLLTTRGYYRSTYVFVTRAGSGLDIRSLDDPRLREVKVGVQLIGDDAANTPPAHALARRGIVRNVVGYTVYGDYSKPNPPAEIVAAVARGDVDVAIVWGPLAGYFAPRQAVELAIAPVTPAIDMPFLPFVFDIAMGVRHRERDRREELDAWIVRRRDALDAILAEYGVPRTDRPAPAESAAESPPTARKTGVESGETAAAAQP